MLIKRTYWFKNLIVSNFFEIFVGSIVLAKYTISNLQNMYKKCVISE